jgi:hypothetical protein
MDVIEMNEEALRRFLLEFCPCKGEESIQLYDKMLDDIFKTE